MFILEKILNEIFKNKLVCLFFLAKDKNLEIPFDRGPKKILYTRQPVVIPNDNSPYWLGDKKLVMILMPTKAPITVKK